MNVSFKSDRFALVLLLLLGACTAEGERYNPANTTTPGREGVIYVYRPEGTVWRRGESPYVQIAGKSFGQLKAGGYIRAVLPEGEHQVTAMQTVFLLLPTIPKSVMVAVVPGSTSYVKVDQRITDFGNSGMASATQEISIEEVSAQVGQEELRGTRQN